MGAGVFMPFVVGKVEFLRDAPHHCLARIHSRVRAAVGFAEEVFYPPAALQSLINYGDERRPPRAGLKRFGTLSTDELSELRFPSVSEGGVLVDLGV